MNECQDVLKIFHESLKLNHIFHNRFLFYWNLKIFSQLIIKIITYKDHVKNQLKKIKDNVFSYEHLIQLDIV